MKNRRQMADAKDVPPYAIAGGVPARPIKKRFDEPTIWRLQQLRWWDWPFERIQRALPRIMNGEVGELTP